MHKHSPVLLTVDEKKSLRTFSQMLTISVASLCCTIVSTQKKWKVFFTHSASQRLEGIIIKSIHQGQTKGSSVLQSP